MRDPFALWGDLKLQPNKTGTWKGFDSSTAYQKLLSPFSALGPVSLHFVPLALIGSFILINDGK